MWNWTVDWTMDWTLRWKEVGSWKLEDGTRLGGAVVVAVAVAVVAYLVLGAG